MNWKTIITYLVDWTPTWIKTVEFSNRLIKGISIPRKDFKDINIEELSFSWIYFLFGEDEEWNDLVYIWQAINLYKRLNDHYKDTNKDFWNTAIGFTYKDWSLTESDINFLEKELIAESKRINRYKITNSTNWNAWLIQRHRIPDMKEFIEDLKILITSLWYPILKEIINKKELENENSIYYLIMRWSEAKGIYTDEWFLVLKWSKWPKELQKSVIEKKHYAFRNRPKLLIEWVIKEEWDNIVFNKDYLFKSPSWASDLVTWWSFNWRDVWKNKSWKTLNDIERNALSN